MMLSLVFDSTSDLLIRCLRAVVAYLDVSVYVCVCVQGRAQKKVYSNNKYIYNRV